MNRIDFINKCAVLGGGTFVFGGLLGSCTSLAPITAERIGSQLKIAEKEFMGEDGKEKAYLLVTANDLVFPIALFHDNETKEYFATYLKCSHQGCEVKPGANLLVCPCHGSEFSTKGKVLSAPADADLDTFKVITDGSYIFIQL